jgi:hypothetical protein
LEISRLIEKLDDCLLTRLRNLDEINALQPYLVKFQDTQDIIAQLPALPVGQARSDFEHWIRGVLGVGYLLYFYYRIIA